MRKYIFPETQPKMSFHSSESMGVQEVIESYLQSCTRSRPGSFGDDDDQADSDDNDDEQSKQDFKEFKAWLDTSTPSSSDAPPSKMVPTKGSCKICGMVECRCTFLQFISYDFILISLPNGSLFPQTLKL